MVGMLPGDGPEALYTLHSPSPTCGDSGCSQVYLGTWIKETSAVAKGTFLPGGRFGLGVQGSIHGGVRLQLPFCTLALTAVLFWQSVRQVLLAFPSLSL